MCCFRVRGNLPGAGADEAQLAGLLGALAALYVPLEIRDLGQERSCKVSGLGWAGTKAVLEEALAIERGRIVCRDIGGSDPERTAAPRVEEYIREYFAGSSVKVEVVQGQKTFEAEYPCLAAVNRCASTVARHDGRVIWLTYEPKDGKVEKSLFLVGKGITYDTGGADIKVRPNLLTTNSDLLTGLLLAGWRSDGRDVPRQMWSCSCCWSHGHCQPAGPGWGQGGGGHGHGQEQRRQQLLRGGRDHHQQGGGEAQGGQHGRGGEDGEEEYDLSGSVNKSHNFRPWWTCSATPRRRL